MSIRAVRIHAHGGPEVLVVDAVAEPTPGPGEVRIAVRATSINHLDLWVRKGIPGLTLALPHVMGSDAAGSIESLGSGVEGLSVGDRVLVDPGLGCGRCRACQGGEPSLCPRFAILGEHVAGTMAELIVVPAASCHAIPDGLGFEEAAALPLVFLTAWRMLITRARLTASEELLVLGATGGVGSAAVQIGRYSGARVIAVSSSAEKAEKLRALGVDEVIEAPGDELHKRVRRLTHGRGVDVVVDSVGQATWSSSLKCLANGGRLVTCGATSGPEAVTDLRHVFFRQLEILGSTMGSGRELAAALEGVRRGALRPVVDSVVRFDAVRAAHERVASRQIFGKLVVTP